MKGFFFVSVSKSILRLRRIKVNFTRFQLKDRTQSWLALRFIILMQQSIPPLKTCIPQHLETASAVTQSIQFR